MIRIFKNKYAFLSNFYEVEIDGYPTLEHAYQAAKFTDGEIIEEIQQVKSPRTAKRVARKYSDKVRENWFAANVAVMYKLLLKKFSSRELRDKLLSTGKQKLIEGNDHHDNFWGDCICEKCKDVQGENKLGKLLMIVRDNVSWR